MDELICKAEIEKDAENKCMDIKRGKGEDEMGDLDRHMYTSIYKA